MSPSIGFDFDECLVQAYTIVPFVLLFEVLLPRAMKAPGYSKNAKFYINKARSVFYQKVADNEVKTKGTLFRPSLLKLMPKLIKLRQEGKIHKLFIYSNNGINELLNAVDHILALTLKKAPYSVNDGELIKEADGLHVMVPRIHIDNPCRVSTELKGADGFREKTLSGIQQCIGENISEKDLWFLDDTEYHKDLMDHLKEKYIVVESYSVYLSNKALADMFIDSFPLEFFLPGSPIASALIPEINRLMPGFRPTSKETKASLIEKFGKVLNKFSEPGAGRVMAVWKEDHVNSDLKKIETKLSNAIHQETPVISNYPTVYSPPVGGANAKACSAPLGGALHRGILPPSSLRRKTRKLRKDKRKRE
jgi:hypothetical protein